MFKFLRRLFEPSLQNKVKTIKMISDAFISYVWYDLIPIISIPILIGYINDYDYQSIKEFTITILGVTVFMLLIQFLTVIWQTEGRYSFEQYLIKRYFKKSILKDPIFMDKIGSGKLQSIIKTGTRSWTAVNGNVVYGLTRVVTGVGTGIYIILNFDAKFIPYFLLIILISCAGYYLSLRKKLKYDERVVGIENELDKDYVRVMMSRQEIILAVNENKESENLTNLTNKQLKEDRKATLYEHTSELFTSGLSVLLPIIGVLFLIQNIELNAVNAAFLISFIYFTTRFTGTLYNMVWIINEVFNNYSKIKKLWNFLDTTPNFENYYKGEKFQHGNGSIELNEINFSYDDKKIFNNFNLKIKGGQKIAFVGKSGSGKTTIAKLITGFVTPQEGQVLIDGQDMSRIALKTYYPYIGYLTQEPMIFDGTIKNNLLYSLPDKTASTITDQQLHEVLKNAECDFITDLNTEIGEKGIRLSGGERQRLAIAKLMLKNPEIIILDEPTSALDSFSEEAITRALDCLFKNKTVIIIAHRLQTVKKADVIIVLENGKIIEQGTSVELIEKNGQYKKMLELQSF
jgi:ABC-type multidrug transport system fused ATPase/permease subunit